MQIYLLSHRAHSGKPKRIFDAPNLFRKHSQISSVIVLPQVKISTVKTCMKETLHFGVRLAKVLKLRSFNRTFCQTISVKISNSPAAKRLTLFYFIFLDMGSESSKVTYLNDHQSYFHPSRHFHHQND